MLLKGPNSILCYEDIPLFFGINLIRLKKIGKLREQQFLIFLPFFKNSPGWLFLTQWRFPKWHSLVCFVRCPGDYPSQGGVMNLVTIFKTFRGV